MNKCFRCGSEATRQPCYPVAALFDYLCPSRRQELTHLDGLSLSTFGARQLTTSFNVLSNARQGKAGLVRAMPPLSPLTPWHDLPQVMAHKAAAAAGLSGILRSPSPPQAPLCLPQGKTCLVPSKARLAHHQACLMVCKTRLLNHKACLSHARAFEGHCAQ